MKFDCGTRLSTKQLRLAEWHKFFPLWPRAVSTRDCRWLEWIEVLLRREEPK